ncbi:hypothetical protein JCM14469_26180 [Desulfatiferula olefinivorans]
MTEKIYPALQLTDACNKRCKACLRIPDHQAHKLCFDDIERYMNDLRVLAKRYTIGFQFVTGGEPTIWKDGGKDVGDVLIALSRLGLIRSITMPTNGKRFENLSYVTDLIKRLSVAENQTLIIGVSVADYQENFIDGRCLPLENLCAAVADTESRVLPIALVTLFREDAMHEKLKASYPSVFQRITPLAPLGAGQDFIADCPSVSLSTGVKDTIGSFLPHFRKDVTARLGLDDAQFDALNNGEIMNRMSLYAHCGQSPFIDDRWHYCLPFRENPAFDIAPIGEMRENSLADFIEEHPFLQSIRSRGLLATVDHYKECLTDRTRKKLDAMYQPDYQVSVAYRGCMICKELAGMGVWTDIERGTR